MPEAEAIPVALTVNELLTHAIKHGLRPAEAGAGDVAARCVLEAAGDGIAIDPAARYRLDPEFAGRLVRPPVSHRLRRAASLTRKRVLGAVGR